MMLQPTPRKAPVSEKEQRFPNVRPLTKRPILQKETSLIAPLGQHSQWSIALFFPFICGQSGALF